MKSIIVFLPLFLTAMPIALQQKTRIDQFCQPVGPTFQPHGSAAPLDYDLLAAFTAGHIMGSGGFGEVRKVVYLYDGLESVAVKSVQNTKDALDEFRMLILFGPNGIGPRFIGCQYSPTRIYIVMELFHSDLTKKEVVYQLRKQPNSSFVKRTLEAVKDLAKMWKLGFVHNDIKPNNIMTNKDASQWVAIDFGLASPKNENMPQAGTLFYFSPEKWKYYPGLPRPADDLYSLALSVIQIQATLADSELVGYPDPGNPAKTLYLPNSCFKSGLTQFCQNVLKQNGAKILQKANFGNFHHSPALRKASTINYTTFISLMIQYRDFDFTYDEVIQILTRHLQEFEEIEKQGKLSYVPKQRDWKFTDPSDVPDNYEFGRKYPQVHPSDVFFFEHYYKSKYDQKLPEQVKAETEWAKVVDQIRKERQEIEKKKKEALEAQLKLKELKEMQEKERQAKIVQQQQELAKLRREEYRKKLEKDRQERDRKEKERQEMERQEKQRLEEERLKKERREKEQLENERLMKEKQLAEQKRLEEIRLLEEKNRQDFERLMEEKRKRQEEAAQKVLRDAAEKEQQEKEAQKLKEKALKDLENLKIVKMANPQPAQELINNFQAIHPDLFKIHKKDEPANPEMERMKPFKPQDNRADVIKIEKIVDVRRVQINLDVGKLERKQNDPNAMEIEEEGNQSTPRFARQQTHNVPSQNPMAGPVPVNVQKQVNNLEQAFRNIMNMQQGAGPAQNQNMMESMKPKKAIPGQIYTGFRRYQRWNQDKPEVQRKDSNGNWVFTGEQYFPGQVIQPVYIPAY